MLLLTSIFVISFMELSKKNISKTLEKISISGSDDNIVSSGAINNIQVFGDQVDIDLSLSNPCLLYTSPSPRDPT